MATATTTAAAPITPAAPTTQATPVTSSTPATPVPVVAGSEQADEVVQVGNTTRGEKMSVMGVGTKIAIPILLYTGLAVGATRLFSPAFRITGNSRALKTMRAGGALMSAAGFSLNLVAAFSMLKANKEDRLATGGLYHLFRDPMYVLQIFVTLPGLFLLLNSWLVLSV